MPDIERRFLPSSLELRAADGEADSRKIFGYAAKFGNRSQNLGSKDYQFYEIIEPGAFDAVLASADVRALFNHDPSQILARSKAGEGTLAIGVDGVGLWYEFDAPDTQAGNDLLLSIRRKDIDQSSFSFSVEEDGQEWKSTKEGEGPVIYVRTIKKVSGLYDVSPVTYPAYTDTTVASRSLEAFRGEAPEPPEAAPEQLSEVSDWAARFGN